MSMTKYAYFLATLLSIGTLSACQKPADTSTQTPATHEHQAENHDNHDNIENHDNGHAGHDHAEHHFTTYTCGDKTIQIEVQESTDKKQAFVLIDDIEYEFNGGTQKDTFIAQDDMTGKHMLMQISDNTAKLYDYSNQTQGNILFDCQKTSSETMPTTATTTTTTQS